MQPEKFKLTAADGCELAACVFAAANPRATVVLAPALGVPQRFYADFATALAERGIAALTFDYRGVDYAQHTRERVRLAHWGERDLEAALRVAQQRWPDQPHFLIGHSIGAQLIGLAPAGEQLAGFVFVAVTAPHPRQWRGAARARIWSLLNLAVPLLSLGRRRFPARRVGLGSIDVPAGVVSDWARYARNPRYLFNPRHALDTARYTRLAQPALSWEFTDDSYAPEEATSAFLRELPVLRCERRRISPRYLGVKQLGHFGFFRRDAGARLWQQTAEWILAVTAQRASARRVA